MLILIQWTLFRPEYLQFYTIYLFIKCIHAVKNDGNCYKVLIMRSNETKFLKQGIESQQSGDKEFTTKIEVNEPFN